MSWLSGFETVDIQRDYELFFTVLSNPNQVLALPSVGNYRRWCKKAICFLVEVWEKDFEPKFGRIWELLSEFDHIFLGVNHCVERVSEITGRPCSYLPFATDTLRFCPATPAPPRHIDVYSIGRWSPSIHASLLDLAGPDFLYQYDTFAGHLEVNSHSEHRSLYAHLLQRSRLFLAHRANINEPQKTQSHQEIGSRFFEGAAGGAIVLGEHPKTEVFRRLFDWDDAAIYVPFDTKDIRDVLAELSGDFERCAAARFNNVLNSLKRHDWLHRWLAVLEVASLPPNAEITDRQQSLDRRIDRCRYEDFLRLELDGRGNARP